MGMDAGAGAHWFNRAARADTNAGARDRGRRLLGDHRTGSQKRGVSFAPRGNGGDTFRSAGVDHPMAVGVESVALTAMPSRDRRDSRHGLSLYFCDFANGAGYSGVAQ